MSAEVLREGRQNTEFYSDLLASVMREVSAGVYQLVTTTGISDRVMSTLREGRPDVPYFDDLWSKVMSYDAGTDKWYLNVSGGGGGGGNLQTTLNAGNTANNVDLILTKNSVDNEILLDIDSAEISLKRDTRPTISLVSQSGGGLTGYSGILKIIDTNLANNRTRIHLLTGNSSSISVSQTIGHLLQSTTGGTLIQSNNDNGLGAIFNGGQITVNDANVYINGDASALITFDPVSQLQGTFNGNAISLDHLDGSGTVDYNLLRLAPDSLQLYDTGGSGSIIEILPYQYNNQQITWPDITGGMKTVGTFNDTFVSGVITLTDSRFDIGQPNFIVMITNTNGSSALGQAYKFELLTLPTRVKITSLKQNGATETNDGSSVRISCLF